MPTSTVRSSGTTDPYARITELDEEMVAYLAQRLDARAAEPGQREMRAEVLGRLQLRGGARVLEVGCGTGAWSRDLAKVPGVACVVATDPSPHLINVARTSTSGDEPIRYDVADGRSLPFDDATFDVVVFATSLCHVPEAEAALAEARRVLRTEGTLLVFDGDYVTTTVALWPNDPLQSCIADAVGTLVHDAWIMRSLPAILKRHDFRFETMRSHGYVETGGSSYVASVVDFGVSTLAAQGRLSPGLADELKAEARRRIEDGTFFGHIAYASVVAIAEGKE
jgi:ubiquinone/menaquinone biosynthesis C-methylase UbiE